MKLLKLGSRGKQVEEVQRRLKELGFYTGELDGIFGKGMKSAVVAFQKSEDAVGDGIVGNNTYTALKLKRGVSIKDTALKESDLVLASQTLGVELEAIRAVSEVESRGGGFLADGQVKVLFERHVFNRRLKAVGLTLAAELGRNARPDLVNTSTGGYRGGAHENKRLDMATRLNREVGLESASYGRYQIMGFHWQRLGYSSVEDYVERMKDSEGEQLKAFVQFIKTDTRLHKALKEKDWTTFAEIYNGSGHKSYDVKMQDAYDRMTA